MKAQSIKVDSNAKRSIYGLSSNKSGFTLVELLVVVTILGVIIYAVANKLGTGSGGDVVRQTVFKDMAYYSEDFKQKYGTYPTSSSTARNYPKTGCSVNGYKALIDCFVALGYFQQDDDTYKKLVADPKDGTQNDSGQTYAYKYCVNAKGTKYKFVGLVEKQNDDQTYPYGEDGKTGEVGKRVLTVVSPATKPDEVTGCAQ